MEADGSGDGIYNEYIMHENGWKALPRTRRAKSMSDNIDEACLPACLTAWVCALTVAAIQVGADADGYFNLYVPRVARLDRRADGRRDIELHLLFKA